ncbi:Membrane protein, suppressor for copper-sensitivity ScsD [hydrothermal vent metagenome]|uniref:Membrane protein, suppressor for copper-sensitivity ScsD n=1 Tax=hydrothermal vent metagenome TaxID=652676 RepID=A0A1W1BPI8_9ZZZZ
MIKKVFKEIIIGLVLLFIISNIISYIRKPDLQNKNIPELNLKDINDKSINFIDYKGKPLVLHFWATWCPVCKLELSNINSISNSKDYKIITIAVNSGDDKEIKEFMREKDVDFIVINDKDGELSKEFLVKAFPTTIIYDSNGELMFGEVGYTTTAGLLARLKLADKK